MAALKVSLFLVLVAGCQTGGGQEVCDDVAVVGAGPGGTYAAYRLRNQGLSVTLYEYSDRVGGRLFTRHLPGAEDVNAEMGGMTFHRELHPIFAYLVDELGLPARKTDARGELLRLWLRHKSLGMNFTASDLPYKLTKEEKDNQKNLFMHYIQKLVGENTTVTKQNLLDLKTADGSKFLYELSVKDGLRMAGASEEALVLLRDGEVFQSMYDDDVSLVNTLAFLQDLAEYSNLLTLQDGMDALPKSLLLHFLLASPAHRYQTNRHLLGLQTALDGSFLLNLELTQTVDGETSSLGVMERACARRVILALPRMALERLQWKPLQENATIRKLLQSVGDKHAFKIQAAYPTAWWRSAPENASGVASDTDLGYTIDFGDSVRGSSVLLASYSDGGHVEQWRRLQGQGQWLEFSPPGPDGMTSAMLDHLHSLLAQEFGLTEKELPMPVSAACRLWDVFPFGAGWTLWKPGFRWDAVWEALRQPVWSQEVFIVGSSFAPGSLTTWSEGALRTVDDVMRNFFGV